MGSPWVEQRGFCYWCIICTWHFDAPFLRQPLDQESPNMTRTTTLTAADGTSVDAYIAEPAGPPQGAVVVLQEIFGVNAHIRNVADGYAAAGYVAVAPSTFQRARAGVGLGYTEADMGVGIALKAAAEALPAPGVLADVQTFQQAQPGVEVHIYPAQHGFNCDHRGAWDAPSAALARERTLAFLARHVG
jgi:dienelactone hydrolase